MPIDNYKPTIIEVTGIKHINNTHIIALKVTISKD